ncbi:MAG: hypothetical protein HWD61_02175 [Parachlamydiaceae bacterium]|nr:MAG: hypothetical protein HWD61_02175 [Parachlamydiaceae bacterium]
MDEKWNDTNFVEKTIFNIMALMLPKSELDYLKWDKRLEGAIVDPETPFTAEEKLQRYEALKKAINDLPSQFLDLNVAIDRDKSTLLLFAIDQINDKDQRFEIVKLLLQKGASIETISGLYEVKTNAINAAQEKGDFRLVGLFLGVGSREQLSLQSLEEARDILLNFVHKDIEIFKNYAK